MYVIYIIYNYVIIYICGWANYLVPIELYSRGMDKTNKP